MARPVTSPIVLDAELGAQHRALVSRFRAAGTLGLTRREMRAAVGAGYRGLLRDLQRHGYGFEVHRSDFDDKPWRWVLRSEPVRPYVEGHQAEAARCDHCTGPGAATAIACPGCGAEVWLHPACREDWLRGSCQDQPDDDAPDVPQLELPGDEETTS